MAVEVSSLRTIDESARKRFEAAWQAGRPEPIERCLPPTEDPRYLATLEELIQIDLEFAWKATHVPTDNATVAAHPPLVEAYLARFPQLKLPTIVQRLLHQEFRVRHLYGDAPTENEFRQRFPEFNPPTLPTPRTSPRPAPASPLLPQVPGYEVLCELGRGGMGVVYQARQQGLNRLVALKMILAGGHADAAELARFRIEAEAIARLQHPNVVQIHEVGEHEGRPFFALEYVAGGSLAKRLGGTPLPAEEAARLVEALARAVHVAHHQGVVHRDLKPANVLLTFSREPPASALPALAGGQRLNEAVPKVTDFGLAKLLSGDAGQTRTGDVLGTPSYMAPEQAAGRTHDIGPAADVYALGAILYECLTGRPPFRAATVLATLEQVRSQEPVAPSRLQPSLPRDLETICLKCLQKEPGKRYAGADALADELRRFCDGVPIRARPVGATERVWRWAKRKPWIAGLSAALVVLSLAAIIGPSILVVFLNAARTAAQHNAEQERKAREDATTQRGVAEERAEALRLNLYVAQMNTAFQQWVRGNVPAVLDLLGNHLPEPGQDDLRGFEWYYLYGQCYQEALRIPGADEIRCVAFSPDGRTLAVADGSSRVGLWDATSGQQRAVLEGHTAGVRTLAFSPDGRLLATGAEGGDRTVRVWDLGTRRERAIFRGHSQPVTCVAFSPDGKTLASGSADKTVKLWDPAAPSGPTAVLAARQTLAHPDGVSAVAFSPDGRSLAASCGYYTPSQGVTLWDLARGVPRARHSGGEFVYSLAFSPDGSLLALGSGPISRSVVLLDAATAQPRGTLRGHADAVVAVAFARDGKTLVSGSWDGTVKVWDLAARRERRSIAAHLDNVRTVALAPDGRRLATGSTDRAVKIWDTADLADGRRPRANSGATHAVAFAPDGRSFVSAEGNEVAVWDTRLAQKRGAFPVPTTAHNTRSVAYSPDGTAVAVGTWDGSTIVYNPATGQERFTAKGFTTKSLLELVEAVAFSPDGKTLAIAGRPNGMPTVKLWDVATGAERATLTTPGTGWGANSLAFAPDGKTLAVGTVPLVVLWDLNPAGPPTLLATLRAHTDNVQCLAFAPDGQTLISGGWDKWVVVWDVAGRRERFRFRAHTGRIMALALSPDGKTLATGSEADLKLWHVATWQEIATLPVPEGGLRGAAFAPDGLTLVAATQTGGLYIWKAASPEAVRQRAGDWLLRKVVDCERRQQWGDAVGHLDRLLQREPSAPLHARRGRAAANAGRGDAAVADYATALEIQPDDGAVWLCRSLAHARLGQDGEADRAFDRAMLYSYTMLKLEADQIRGDLAPRAPVVPWAEVAADCSRALEAGAGTWWLWRGRGLAHAALYQWDQADAAFAQAAARRPDDGLLWYLRGRVSHRLERWPQAVAELTRAAERGCHEAGIWEFRGEALAQLQRWQEAAADFEQAIARAPRSAPSWINRAVSRHFLGQDQEALADLTRAIELRPDDADAWRLRGLGRHALKQWDAAAADFTRFVALQPEDWRGWHGRGQAHAEQGRWDAAASDFLRAVMLNPTTVSLHIDHLLGLRAAGRTCAFRAARAEFLQRFGGIDDPVGAAMVAGPCLLSPDAEDCAERVVQLLERARKQRPADPVLRELLGVALYRAGRDEEAIARLNEVIQAPGPGGTARSWLFLALAYHRRGQDAEAQRCLHTAWTRADKETATLEWQGRLVWRLVRSEADRLLKPAP
jgi:WD40 repeat protein/serine/threonine protein kinase/Flp pilus assembly protein TadD